MRSSSANFDMSDLGDEDLRLTVTTDNIAIAGGSPRGTIYGVYTFVEDFLGVRFLAPDHTHVPKVAAPLVIEDQTKTVRPVFHWRYCYYGANHQNHAFAVRLRNNAVTTDPWRG